MSNLTITVVGTGLIGTSLGLALKQQDDPPRLLAHDKDLENARAAVDRGAFDKAEWNLVNACEPADLIILAIPLNGVRPTLEAIAPYLKEGAVVSDTCRSKEPVLAWANDLLPDQAHFVGGDPVVHAPGSGYDYASANLFRDRLYCLTPAPAANEQAVQLMVGLLGLLGADPFFLDAAEHDGLIAAVEYLPELLSVALMNTLAEQNSWRELRKLAGGRFEQISAGAEGDPDGMRDGYLANRDTLVRWLDRYQAELETLRTLLTSTDSEEALAQTLDKAVVARRNWLADYHRGRFDEPELASQSIESPGFFRQLIGFGGWRRKSGSDKK